MEHDYPAVGTTFSLALPLVLDSLRAVRPLLPPPSISSPDNHSHVPTLVELQTRTHPLGKGLTVKCKLGSRPSGRRRPGEQRLSDGELCNFRLVLQRFDSLDDPSIPSYVITESIPHSHYPHQHQHTLFPRDCHENDANTPTLDPSSSARLDFDNRLLVFRSGFAVPVLQSRIPSTRAHHRSSHRRRPAASLDHDGQWVHWEDTLGLDGQRGEKRKRRKVFMEMGGFGALKAWGWVDGLGEFGMEEESSEEEEVGQEQVFATGTSLLDAVALAPDDEMEAEESGGEEAGTDEQQVGDQQDVAAAASASPTPPPLTTGAQQQPWKTSRRRRFTSVASPAWLPGVARNSRQATRSVSAAEASDATDSPIHLFGYATAERQDLADEIDEAMREEEEALDKLASDVAAFLIRPQRMHIKSQAIAISTLATLAPLTPFKPPARNLPKLPPISPHDSSVTTSSHVDSYFSPCRERDTSLSSVETPTRTFARPRTRSVRFADEEVAKEIRAPASGAPESGKSDVHFGVQGDDQTEEQPAASNKVDKGREEQALQGLLGLFGWRPQPLPPTTRNSVVQNGPTASIVDSPPSPLAISHPLPGGDTASSASPFSAGPSLSATSALGFRPRVSTKAIARRPTPASALFNPSVGKSALAFSSRASKPFVPPSLQGSGASRAVAVAQASAREREERQQAQGSNGSGRVSGTPSYQPDETAQAEALRERLWRSRGDAEGGRLDPLYWAATLDRKFEQIRSVTPFPTPPILRTPSSVVYIDLLSKPHRPSRARLPNLQSLPTFDTSPDILGPFNDKRIRLALEYLYGRSVSLNEMAFLERRETAVWTLARTMAAVAEVNERVMRMRSSGLGQDEPRWRNRG
ncbi:ATP-dependent RNA helicase DBP8 [Rhodotorula toruloides]|uniref:ATP-dependent RNA helicase DBP8 n=1 Tax=Rhodotorula toruloides TaxID=5286 RepID=A0A511KFN8_RHOTO|nr:ATP-dependent RNA helicase DBP8 [Rhodotorula toruloides]